MALLTCGFPPASRLSHSPYCVVLTLSRHSQADGPARAAALPTSRPAPQGARLPPPPAQAPLRATPAARRRVAAGAGSARHTTGGGRGFGDPDLREVLELASNEELEELAGILYGPSTFSPVVKSLSSGQDVVAQNVLDIAEGGAGREAARRRLEERFLFLAADSVTTLRGRLPTYRQALLSVVKRLRVECSTGLSTSDLELEIFLFVLERYSRDARPAPGGAGEGGARGGEAGDRSGGRGGALEVMQDPGGTAGSSWRGTPLTPLELGGEELVPPLVSGGAFVTAAALGRRVLQQAGAGAAGRLTTEASLRVMTQLSISGGKGVGISYSRQVALSAARQAAGSGVAAGAGRAAAVRGGLAFLGPVLSAWLVADLALVATGTDYGRVVRAVFALAQIRLTRTYGWDMGEGGQPWDDDAL